ncbi:MAG: type IV toxin-antitoxin system AbiEi family antitoxin domain-containing protein [Actinobacteria bacterium]|nr:type IV toxin-antitoxin system AbiEi family antitoxin domain-containing protein [Actinomycetota bacterium]
MATEQHGVVSTRQLARIGISRNSAWLGTEVGRLHRVHRGVYAVGHRRLTWKGWCMAAVLAAHPAKVRLGHMPIVASHLSAGRLWGIVRFDPEAIEVTVPKRRRSQRPYIVHQGRVSPADRAVVDGIPVTTLARTFFDLAEGARTRTFQKMLQRAEELELLDLDEIDATLVRAPAGTGAALRRQLEIYRPEVGVIRSDLERDFQRLVTEAGLSRPSMNYFLAGHEVDAYWPESKLVVELDVFETHGSRLSFEEDRKRDEDLLLQGISTVRVTGHRLYREPEEIVNRLRKLLR